MSATNPNLANKVLRPLEAPGRPAGVATDAVFYNTAMLAYQILALQGLLGLAWMVLRAATVFEGQCIGACFFGFSSKVVLATFFTTLLALQLDGLQALDGILCKRRPSFTV